MQLNTLGQTLQQSLNDPESWIRQAEQQYLVAQDITPKIRERTRTEAGNLLEVGYLKTALLLLALAVENALKSIKACRNELQVDDRGLTRATRGGGRNGHELTALAGECGFALSQHESALLEKLTSIGTWAGKYHAPILNTEYVAANRQSPKSLSIPGDIELVKGIIIRAAAISKVTAVVA